MLLLLQELLAHIEADYVVLQELEAVTKNSNARFLKLRFMLSGIIVRLLEDEIRESIVKIEPQDNDQEHTFFSHEGPFSTQWNESNSTEKRFGPTALGNSLRDFGYDADDSSTCMASARRIKIPRKKPKKHKQEAIKTECRSLSDTDPKTNATIKVHYSSNTGIQNPDQKQSLAWKYFRKHKTNRCKSVCTICHAVISRENDSMNLGIGRMFKHLESRHGITAGPSDEPVDNLYCKPSKPPRHKLHLEKKKLFFGEIAKKGPHNEENVNFKSTKITENNMKKSQTKHTYKGARTSFSWKYFDSHPDDTLKAVCRICGKHVSRGRLSEDEKTGLKRADFTTSCMLSHLSCAHSITKENDLTGSFVWTFFDCDEQKCVCKICKLPVGNYMRSLSKVMLIEHLSDKHSIARKSETAPAKAKSNKKVNIPDFPWKYFTVCEYDKLSADCNMCGERYSLGKDENNLRSRNLASHLDINHGIKNPRTCGNSGHSFAWSYAKRDPFDRRKATCNVCNRKIGAKYLARLPMQIRVHLNKAHGIYKKDNSHSIVNKHVNKHVKNTVLVDQQKGIETYDVINENSEKTRENVTDFQMADVICNPKISTSSKEQENSETIGQDTTKSGSKSLDCMETEKETKEDTPLIFEELNDNACSTSVSNDELVHFENVMNNGLKNELGVNSISSKNCSQDTNKVSHNGGIRYNVNSEDSRNNKIEKLPPMTKLSVRPQLPEGATNERAVNNLSNK